MYLLRSQLSLPLLFAALLVFSACGDTEAGDAAGDAPTERQATRVEVLEVEPSSFVDIIEVNGTVEALNDASLSAQAAGTVVQLAERGARVGAGQPVAQLDFREAQAAVEQAEAQLETAESRHELAIDNFERQEPLYRDSIISPVEFEAVRAERNQARANVRQAAAQLEQARDRLERTRVQAPFAGTVETRLVQVGEQVSPGDPVARVVDAQRVRITAGIPERYAADIHEGTPVRIELRAQPTLAQQGSITFVGSAVDPQSRTFPIEVEIGNPGGELKPEMVARVYVTRQEIDDALVVPRPAILRDEAGSTVYVAATAGQGFIAEPRSVSVGPQYGNRSVIESGLQAGDLVIVAGQNNVSPGDRLVIDEEHQRVSTVDVPEPPEAE